MKYKKIKMVNSVIFFVRNGALSRFMRMFLVQKKIAKIDISGFALFSITVQSLSSFVAKKIQLY